MKLSENIEEYLEMLYVLEEKGEHTASIKKVSKELKISPPSAVQMLKKLEKNGFVNYKKREGVSLTKDGRDVARKVIRNHRLAETLMRRTLNKKIDEDVVCGLEHHMSEEFADAVCTLLEHPRTCPHGNMIPKGKCC